MPESSASATPIAFRAPRTVRLTGQPILWTSIIQSLMWTIRLPSNRFRGLATPLRLEVTLVGNGHTCVSLGPHSMDQSLRIRSAANFITAKTTSRTFNIETHRTGLRDTCAQLWPHVTVQSYYSQRDVTGQLRDVTGHPSVVHGCVAG